jgi:superoxide reductase
MTKLNEIYKCEICGNIIEVLHTGAGQLVCCNQAMKTQTENTTEAATEKHIPVLEKTENGFKVSVGAIPHPMIAEHYIEWIELIADGKVYRKNLNPNTEAAAEFYISAEKAQARAYCNLHGLWVS